MEERDAQLQHLLDYPHPRLDLRRQEEAEVVPEQARGGVQELGRREHRQGHGEGVCVGGAPRAQVHEPSRDVAAEAQRDAQADDDDQGRDRFLGERRLRAEIETRLQHAVGRKGLVQVQLAGGEQRDGEGGGPGEGRRITRLAPRSQEPDGYRQIARHRQRLDRAVLADDGLGDRGRAERHGRRDGDQEQEQERGRRQQTAPRDLLHGAWTNAGSRNLYNLERICRQPQPVPGVRAQARRPCSAMAARKSGP